MAQKGRPSKYRAEYCADLIEHGKKGLSFEAFGADVGVARQTLYTWEETHPEFKKARELAQVYCLKHWEQVGIDGMLGLIKGFNATIWIFNMKNRFHENWRDRYENLPIDPMELNGQNRQITELRKLPSATLVELLTSE